MTLRLAHGLAVRDGAVLLVASTYASHADPLWNLPGGRVEPGELLADTVVREIREETSLRARTTELAYVSESYDGERHIFAAVFHVEVDGEMLMPQKRDHVVDARWEPIDGLRERIAIDVVREPLLAYLRHGTRYFGTHHAGVTIRWNDDAP
jgi:ADP-ribose pyrophosphatase YjhB (NUDIX family)